MVERKKIGFIFIDGIHHIYHFITVAIELAKNNDVSILTFPSKHLFLKKELHRLDGDNVKIEMLSTNFFTNITETLTKKKIPRASVWMIKNREYIAKNFDAVIFSDFIHHKFVTYNNGGVLPNTFKLNHGIPGRAYAFKEDLKDFEFQFLLGSFHKEQMAKKKLLSENYEIIGYPKLDAINKEKIKFFKNKKTTVLYSPHFDEEFSSWYKKGKEILEFFYNKKDYNLIFAPHVQLFNKRKGVSQKEISDKFYKCDHIHIDLGSQNSVDMTYTKMADVYLGDVSSQIYEFIIEPRPCIFLNLHQYKWKENLDFRFWKCGDVIDNLEDLNKTLQTQSQEFENHYKEIQQKINTENFYTEPNSTASQRAARAIIKYLK